jgi:hypothetical protein
MRERSMAVMAAQIFWPFGADHGALDVFLGRTLHLGEDFAVSRVDGFEGGIAASVE